eukprot:2325121-Prymnesium_polylepis.1
MAGQWLEYAEVGRLRRVEVAPEDVRRPPADPHDVPQQQQSDGEQVEEVPRVHVIGRVGAKLADLGLEVDEVEEAHHHLEREECRIRGRSEGRIQRQEHGVRARNHAARREHLHAEMDGHRARQQRIENGEVDEEGPRRTVVYQPVVEQAAHRCRRGAQVARVDVEHVAAQPETRAVVAVEEEVVGAAVRVVEDAVADEVVRLPARAAHEVALVDRAAAADAVVRAVEAEPAARAGRRERVALQPNPHRAEQPVVLVDVAARVGEEHAEERAGGRVEESVQLLGGLDVREGRLREQRALAVLLLRHRRADARLQAVGERRRRARRPERAGARVERHERQQQQVAEETEDGGADVGQQEVAAEALR